MGLSKEEIQMPRSPSELVAFVNAVRAKADLDKEMRTAGHLRIGYYKVFFDEIVPLAKFAHRIYSEDHKIVPILGNQGYDAEVRDTQGNLIDRIEIANPIDGKSIAETGRELVLHGIGGLRVGDPGGEMEDLIPIIARTAAKKARMDYSDATVVFNVSSFPPFKGFEVQHAEQITRIRKKLADAGFKAKRVFVMLPSGMVERIDA